MKATYLGQICLFVISAVYSQSVNAQVLVSSLAPDVQYQVLVERICVQGYGLHIYRLSSPLNIARVINKVASSIPEGSLGEIGADHMLARWEKEGTYGLIGLWLSSESRVEGFYSILSRSGRGPTDASVTNCHGAEDPPKHLTEWMTVSMGLRQLFSTVDYVRSEPTHTVVYSSWLTSTALAETISRGLRKDGWSVEGDRFAFKSRKHAYSMLATKAERQLSLTIQDTDGRTVLFMIGR